MGIIVDVLRYLTLLYSRESIPGVIPRGIDWIGNQKGKMIAEKPPYSFVDLFPPLPVVQKAKNAEDYYKESTGDISNLEIIAGEMILLHFNILNPAFTPFMKLFEDTELSRQSPYKPLIKTFEEYFRRQPVFEPTGMTLFENLRAPSEASPDSLEGQLRFIKDNWSSFLPDELLEKLMLVLDILQEEQLMRGLGPGQLLALQFGEYGYGYDASYDEPAAFSLDADWMSNVVIIAKSVYVWLDQLSKKYKRHIKYLNDIPDEELDRLARWGFTGLWLIGLWERSPASQKIKEIMGNPEAASSAYSLYDYVIADDLGGEDAYNNLKERAWQRGIRLASDMVPNHMGIYSKWVIEHPDWFVQQSFPPFPCYQYTSVDLSNDSRICLQIEDGYWEHRDAAVVFKRIDKWTGSETFIYHGNDGTSMPWNDTAQLNFTIPEVREAVIRTILHVARKFPIIRFDAAMTLAKKHYQRLWFPQPGDGGAIPSRAEHGMSRADFDKIFPDEFWREVVDRIAAEVPDTLLIAEAFWLMEGYFVRTLGMHRVYNSAFMNMLKMEDNGKYRTTVKNVLEFSSEILKRFVNFMNNPDEATAVEQFGRGDKYYGVAVLMVTMPGLPMFGHGQIEGFTEKYGMEYRKAYWDEQVDEEMVRRHENEVFPLMKKRHLFSGVENFAFYDFVTSEGWVDENVFAYSNMAHGERAIIIYNNAYNTTKGRIHTSTPINKGTGDDSNLIRKTIADALSLNSSDKHLYCFRDSRTKLEFVRSGKQITEEGFYAELHAYNYQAFIDFKEIYDDDGSWSRLNRKLNGSGVHSIDEAYREMILEPVLKPFAELINKDNLISVFKNDYQSFSPALKKFLEAVKGFTGETIDIDAICDSIMVEIKLISIDKTTSKKGFDKQTTSEILSRIDEENIKSITPLIIIATVLKQLERDFRQPVDGDTEIKCEELLYIKWCFKKIVENTLREYGLDDGDAYSSSLLAAIVTAYIDQFMKIEKKTYAGFLQMILDDPVTSEFLQINEYKNLLWFSKDRMELMFKSFLMISIPQSAVQGKKGKDCIKKLVSIFDDITQAAETSKYQVDKFIEKFSQPETAK
ncbi:MAG: alpha-amylase [candidate division Zixibacteria bacterium]|nr:alpha-amylase [candidate division Zixibacteria bacterium]